VGVQKPMKQTSRSTVSTGPLVVRPLWRTSESWPGYLLRLANANGYDGVFPLARRSGTSVGSLFSEKHDETLRRFGMPGSSVGAPSVLSAILPRVGRPHGAGPQTRSRLCPTCVGTCTSPHVPATWESPMAFVCTIHETMLHDRCTNCRARIDYTRDNLIECNCGSAYGRMTTAPAPSWYSNLVGSFAVDSTRRNLHNDVAAAHILLSLASWPTDKQSPRKLRPSTWDFVDSDHLARLAPWFTNWPHGFVGQLRLRLESSPGIRPITFPLDIKRFPVLSTAVGPIQMRA
jgi:hypothetical protein